MPTPSVPSISPLLTPPPERASQSSLCPPEQVHIYTPQSTEESLQSDVVEDYDDSSSTAPLQQPTPPPADTDDALLLESPATTTETAETETEAEHAHNKHADTEQQDDSTKDAPSPLSTVEDSSDCDTRAQLSPVSTSSSGEANSPTYPTVSNSPFPKHRVRSIQLRPSW
ncbi:hypothetical protein EJ05DRAFT_178534 [Pseudovirgaria hyperparasitica]|uniref:Uncharacterized protein n=1 Tax=Pseudovirgaria hyperparasitica TaxID=470096 RepID=A0A6A6WFL9_9PEZI|nr:uncharacterized protein EJ05DRAFT_178534 [Pseudovirgaria hyperparasitica]KAF2761618.1 hypothetical protein EJ05DRAFT_178534 [Pseudovirgaria hyperparasitica]